jgi:asparagine synthase (glutamine-hydrolysing)
LRENGVAQTDRLSMASGVELRLPLLDHKLVETVIGLRKAQSDAHLPPKAWFKAALQGLVPDSVANRPKRGFQPPVAEWYRELFAHYGKNLEDGWLVSNDILHADGARKFARGGSASGAVHPMSFKALVLEEWARGISAHAEPG